jgi:hypothetical protein
MWQSVLLPFQPAIIVVLVESLFQEDAGEILSGPS